MSMENLLMLNADIDTFDLEAIENHGHLDRSGHCLDNCVENKLTVALFFFI